MLGHFGSSGNCNKTRSTANAAELKTTATAATLSHGVRTGHADCHDRN
jgi:hypothetical protein